MSSGPVAIHVTPGGAILAAIAVGSDDSPATGPSGGMPRTLARWCGPARRTGCPVPRPL
jgi:hypothetical protein